MNTHGIAIYSFIAKGLRVSLAPLSLLVLTMTLSIEEISFYYVFFSLIAMKQLAEMGLGKVIRQFIAHKNITQDLESKIKAPSLTSVYDYFSFSYIWFTGVCLFIILIVGPLGYIYFSPYEGNVNWFLPWCILVLVSGISLLNMPLECLLDGTQKQIEVKKVRILCGIIYTLLFITFLYCDLGLYSAPLSILCSELLVFYLFRKLSLIYLNPPKFLELDINKFTIVFKELKSILFRTMIIWGAGYFFWHGFNLIAFKVLTIEMAGQLALTIALARAGLDLSVSMVIGQSTLYGSLIAQDKENTAYHLFIKYTLIGGGILIVGYSAFLIALKFSILDFLTGKILPINICISVFVFMAINYILITVNSYVRCFKVEPFTVQSVLSAMLIPLIFYIFSKDSLIMTFLGCSSVLIVMFIYSIRKLAHFRIIKENEIENI
jgi:hypothetical protein